ncbi:RNA polymerase sigma factor [Caulobacter hibisci]|uniref:RNA polymerase sigma factor n=1 Tax=Caulobacter hibisci TaxID=2035993 RepID=A0ABS0T0T6_9CAUL|nr:RNA polymerase sigma factor [Caulobacter hibisci]MBI1685480.1 RNA polymerase sigma factor [Caulobacter hibisci]
MTPEDEQRRAWFRREILPLEPRLLAYARKFCRDGESDPEDLVHDAFARVIACKTWREIANPAAFASRTVRNIAFDTLRRRKVLTITAVADFEQVGGMDETPGPEATLVARDELRQLREAITELPTQCRRVFTLRKVYSLSPGEIAVRMGLSVSTVEKHLIKGLRYCSERLGRPGAIQSVRIDEGRSWVGKRDRDAKQ